MIGDSFVEAFQVRYCESFHGKLSSHLEGEYAVYTLATSDAPLSQYLKWAQFAQTEFGPERYIFCIIGNDFDESDIRYGIKPQMNQFAFERGDYQFVSVPYRPSLLKRVVRESALVRYIVINLKIAHTALASVFASASEETSSAKVYGDSVPETSDENCSERYYRSRRVIDTFLARLPSASGVSASLILFAVDAERGHIYGDIDDEQYERSYFRAMRSYFITKARFLGYQVLDLDNVFRQNYGKRHQRFEFSHDGHWNANGHSVVFSALLQSGFIPANHEGSIQRNSRSTSENKN